MSTHETTVREGSVFDNQKISSTIVINPSSETEVTMLRNELLIKEQQIQEVISDLKRAEAFITENEAVFFKGEQEKV